MSIAKKLAAVFLCALVIVSAATTVLAYGKAEPKGTEPKTEDVLPPAENTHAIKDTITYSKTLTSRTWNSFQTSILE